MNHLPLDFELFASYRTEGALPSLEGQYHRLWRFVMFLSSVGIPLQWYPPAATPELAKLNRSFDEVGATPAALAMARAVDADQDSRYLGAWNGVEERVGGMVVKDSAWVGAQASDLSVDACGMAPLADADVALSVVKKVVDLWGPNHIQCAPYPYQGVFDDRPAVGWMLYLPRVITRDETRKAARLVAVFDERRQRAGTIVVSTNEPFDVRNAAHREAAHEIEIELVDHDALPLRSELFGRPSS